MIMAMVVVLPAPLPPSRPTIEPRGTEKLMPSTATHVAVGLGEVGDGDGRDLRRACAFNRAFGVARPVASALVDGLWPRRERPVRSAANREEDARMSDDKGSEGRRLGHRPGSAGFPLARPAGQARDHPDQADGDAARPVARLFAGRRRAGEAHRRGSERRLRLHDARQPRRRHLQRHRHPRPRQSRRARLEAGDGRQGGALQALRRHRCDRPRGRHRGRRRVRQRRALPRAVLRRHQPRGHPRARLLRHREPAARADGHPGLPRRPARHRDHRARRPDQRAAADRPRHQRRRGSSATAPAPRRSPASS